MLTAGFDVIRLELLSSPTKLTPPLARYSWCNLATSHRRRRRFVTHQAIGRTSSHAEGTTYRGPHVSSDQAIDVAINRILSDAMRTMARPSARSTRHKCLEADVDYRSVVERKCDQLSSQLAAAKSATKTFRVCLGRSSVSCAQRDLVDAGKDLGPSAWAWRSVG